MIGILNAYEFDPENNSYQKDYTDLFKKYVQKTFPAQDIRDYKVALNDWPKSVDECDIWFVTGSAKSAYDKDPWIKQLQGFIVEIDQKKKRMIAICFGHQLLAEALGGKVEKSLSGWGVGVREFNITSQVGWMIPKQDKVSLLFSHQDQVIKSPANAKILASDSFCPIQIMQIGQHILSLQGHPEFSVEFAKQRLNTRRDKVQKDVYETAINSFTQHHDSDLISRWIQQFCQSSHDLNKE